MLQSFLIPKTPKVKAHGSCMLKTAISTKKTTTHALREKWRRRKSSSSETKP